MKHTLLFIMAFISMPSFSFAVQESITATHKYILGDNDSRNDGRHMAFLEAKRKVLEKAGTYIRSNTKVNQGRLTKDEVTTFSAALLKVDTLSEKWGMSGENLSVTVKVKALVDTKKIATDLAIIVKDSSAKRLVRDQQKQLRELEKKVRRLQTAMVSVGREEAATMRKTRNVAFKQIDALMSKKISIMDNIKTIERNVLKLIEIGMTSSEVKSLMGKPRSASSDRMNYGKYWVILDGGIVLCIAHKRMQNLVPSGACEKLLNKIYKK